ncbi:hypothetical protein LCGC14_2803720 [marine sediment metagenome]|uniref:Methyltransferase type 11 domain-containing protein n=1 Tax=marine sediment metagenome TaxID=412755 RepID=A0A0F8Z8W0_9ZZZZ
MDGGLIVRLHVGCGDILLVGYTNIDIQGKYVYESYHNEIQDNLTTLDNYFKYPFGTKRRSIIVDKKMDLLKKWDYEDESIEEIVMISCLEHFSKNEGEHIIGEIKRVLMPKGKAIIDIPDIQEQIRKFYYTNPYWMMTLVYCNGKNPYSFHRYGYTKRTFEELWGKNYIVQEQNIVNHDYPMLQFEVIKK